MVKNSMANKYNRSDVVYTVYANDSFSKLLDMAAGLCGAQLIYSARYFLDTIC